MANNRVNMGAPAKVFEKIFLEDVEIGFRNFRGLPNDNNAAGDRNFLIFLDPAMAQELQEAGWPVKQLKAKDPDDEPGYIIKAKVKYHYDSDGRATSPRIWQMSDLGNTLLTEKTVGRLDTAEILSCDIELSPYNWERQGRSGVSAYVNRMTVKIANDKFSSKYYSLENEVPDPDDGMEDR